MTVGRKLIATLSSDDKLKPADVPATVAQFALGDAQATNAEVGWLKPAANRIPPNDQITRPFLAAVFMQLVFTPTHLLDTSLTSGENGRN
jgi:hypothetical protein